MAANQSNPFAGHELQVLRDAQGSDSADLSGVLIKQPFGASGEPCLLTFPHGSNRRVAKMCLFVESPLPLTYFDAAGSDLEAPSGPGPFSKPLKHNFLPPLLSGDTNWELSSGYKAYRPQDGLIFSVAAPEAAGKRRQANDNRQVAVADSVQSALSHTWALSP